MNCTRNANKRCVKTSKQNDPSCLYNVKSKRCNVATKKSTVATKKSTISKICITPTTKAVPIQNVFANMAKQLDDTFIVIKQYINMFQNGVTEDVSFVRASKINQMIKKWKTSLYDVNEYYIKRYKDRVEIHAEYDEDYSNLEFWDRLIIYNKNAQHLQKII